MTGRGNLGALPEEYDGFGNSLRVADFGGEFSFPVNYEANLIFLSWQNSEDENIRNKYAKKKLNRPQAQMFTSLEKSLYSMLLSMNLPFSIYGQYLAGPTMDYQLDAAIPELGIAIEADGEIWHNNPEKIARDKRRDIELSANGWTVLRFTDKELKEHSQDVISVISQAIRKKIGNSNMTEEFV